MIRGQGIVTLDLVVEHDLVGNGWGRKRMVGRAHERNQVVQRQVRCFQFTVRAPAYVQRAIRANEREVLDRNLCSEWHQVGNGSGGRVHKPKEPTDV